MENKYTADDLVEALKYLEYDITFGELEEFLDSLNLDDVELVNANDALYELGAEKFLDVYNEYFKNTLHVGDVYRIIDTERPSVCGCDMCIITEYNAETDEYYCLLSDGSFDIALNDEFDFDNAEKIGSVDTYAFIQSKNDLIKKANEL